MFSKMSHQTFRETPYAIRCRGEWVSEEMFRFYFCYHLRLHGDCHENMSAETLRIRREALPEAGEVYEEKMQNYAYYLFPDGSDDPVINGLLGDRRGRLDELGSIMAEMGCGEGS